MFEKKYFLSVFLFIQNWGIPLVFKLFRQLLMIIDNYYWRLPVNFKTVEKWNKVILKLKIQKLHLSSNLSQTSIGALFNLLQTIKKTYSMKSSLTSNLAKLQTLIYHIEEYHQKLFKKTILWDHHWLQTCQKILKLAKLQTLIHHKEE